MTAARTDAVALAERLEQAADDVERREWADVEIGHGEARAIAAALRRLDALEAALVQARGMAWALCALIPVTEDLDLRDAYEHGAAGKWYTEPDELPPARAALAAFMDAIE